MANELEGQKIAILAADGVEQVELEQPRDAVEQAGAETELLSVHSGEIQAMNSDINPADRLSVDKVVGEASVDDYAGLIVPGGAVNPTTCAWTRTPCPSSRSSSRPASRSA
ncbi:MAG TPA: DJ-1/PfpI family protein [Thermoleophilaceae bacterium]|nr:DJ-1/PfpI family protein [Thermoleophilaceae bacterium]